MPTRIPAVTGQSIAPQPMPGVFQDASGARGAFGENAAAAGQKTGEALVGAGDKLGHAALEGADADQRLNQRYDAIARHDALVAARMQLEKEYLAESQGGDNFASEQSVARFRERAVKVTGDTTTKWSGSLRSDESRLQLRLDMDQLRSKYEAQAVAAGVEESGKRLDQWNAQTVGELANLVAQNPAAMSDAIGKYRQHLQQNYAPGKTPAEEAAALAAGTETIATAAVDHYIALQRLDAAREVLHKQSVNGYLGANRQRELNLKIIATEVEKQRRLEEAGKGVVVPAGGVLAGRDGNIIVDNRNSDKPKAHIIPKGGTLTDSEGKVLFHSPAEDEAPFGKTPAGRAHAFFGDLENAKRFATGVASSDERNEFLMHAVAYATEDPITRQRRVLPPQVQDALRAQGLNPDTLQRADSKESVLEWLVSAAGSRTGGAANPRALFERQAGADAVDTSYRAVNDMSERVKAAMQAARAGGPGRTGSVAEAMQERGVSVFKYAEALTGFVSTVQRFGHNYVGISDVSEFFRDESLTVMRQQYDGMITQLQVALNETPRYADAFRQEIKERIKRLEGGALLQNPSALKAAWLGLDDYLAIRAATEQETLAGKTLPPEEHKERTQFLNNILNMRKMINAPPRVRSEAEINALIQSGKLLPGDPFVFVDQDLSLKILTYEPGND